MKAVQKFIHLSILLVLFLATTGFRVNVAACHGAKETSISLSSESGCCCSKKKSSLPEKSCNDITCVMQRSVASQNTFNASTQQIAKAQKEPVRYPSFTETIRPVILETIPFVTLPPPMSGRDIGILYQTFLI